MTESLYHQIAEAEAEMRASEEQIGRFRAIQDAVAGIVGRGEAADGKIVVESASGEAVRSLEIDPRAMRLPSMDLAAAIKDAIGRAQADLREKMTEAVAAVGGVPNAPSPEQMREMLASAREQFIDGARQAASGLSDAQRLLRERGTR